jgi:TolA-binding protein
VTRRVDVHPEDLLDAAHARRLDDSGRRRLRQHLEHCASCAAEVALIDDLADDVGPRPGDEALLDRLVANAVGDAPPVAPSAPKPATSAGAPRRLLWAVASVALAIGAFGGAAAAMFAMHPQRDAEPEVAESPEPEDGTERRGRRPSARRADAPEVVEAPEVVVSATELDELATSDAVAGSATAADAEPSGASEAEEPARGTEEPAGAGTAGIDAPAGSGGAAARGTEEPAGAGTAGIDAPAGAGGRAAAEEPPAPPSAGALLAAANQARREHRYRAAVRTYRRLQALHPRSREATLSHVSLGRLLLDGLGDARGALAQFDRYLSRRRHRVLDEEARVGRALALMRLGRRDAERRAWRELLEHHPDTLHAHRARARLAP